MTENQNKPIYVGWADAFEAAKDRPEGYIEDLKLLASSYNNERLEFTKENYELLRFKYLQITPSVPLDTKQVLKNFGSAAKRWVKAGFEVVPKAVFDNRSKICEECPFWSGNTTPGYPINFCTKCGCTKLKAYLPTEKCPIGKW